MSNAQESRGSKLTRQLLLGTAACLLLVMFAGLFNLKAIRDARLARNDTLAGQDVLRSTRDVQLQYALVTGDIRAFLLTGRDGFRNAFQDGMTRLQQQLGELRTLSQGDATLLASVGELQAEVEVRQQQFVRALSTYSQGGREAVVALANDPAFARSSAHIDEVILNIIEQQRDRIATHMQLDRERQDQISQRTLLFLGASLLTVMWLTWRTLGELRARAAAEHLTSAIIEDMPVKVLIKDAGDLRLVRVNKALERLLKRSRATMLNKDDHDFFPPDFARAHIESERALIEACRRGGTGEAREELPIETPIGQRILAVRKVVLRDPQGRPAQLLSVAVDVTEQRRAEQQLRGFSEQLTDKTRALEASNRELESFSYSVSHDLRAPLRAVDGYAAILEEDYGAHFDDEGRRYLRAIRQGATRMGQLIQDLLSFSHLSRRSLAPVVSQTPSLVAEAWRHVQGSHPESRAQLVVGDLPPTWGDPHLLLQVWINLLDNAVKYSSRTTTPEVYVDGHADGAETVFRVRDNGAGFDMRYYDKLFKAFQRLHAEADYSGTGVGLAIVQRVVARHGGRVWGEGKIGEGATFCFALPIV
jgi:signal transduction histidine kinase/CHASE3 domain sensor protein